ncbi:MAG: type II toxin-antitoxin system ParD family antitoxin [bacterium]|nr:type II toxin-antitoxin system ParD family antitoxin [bacterium]
MSTLSVPLTPQLEEIVNRFVRSGFAHNKAEVVRKALTWLAEEEAINAVLETEREPRILRGDLMEIAKSFPDHD